jgi:hypothetical protein
MLYGFMSIKTDRSNGTDNGPLLTNNCFRVILSVDVYSCIYLCVLFNDWFSDTDYITSNDGMIMYFVYSFT